MDISSCANSCSSPADVTGIATLKKAMDVQKSQTEQLLPKTDAAQISDAAQQLYLQSLSDAQASAATKTTASDAVTGSSTVA